jgi:hypothetical protein
MRLISVLAFGPAAFFVNQYIFPFSAKFKHPQLKRWIVERIPIKRVQDVKTAVDMMYKTSVEIIEVKKRGLESEDPQVISETLNRKDIISILSRSFIVRYCGYP